MRTVAVITTSRADYGHLRPLLRGMKDDKYLKLQLYVCGTHLAAPYGQTVDYIMADGFSDYIPVWAGIPHGTDSGHISLALGDYVTAFARVWSTGVPDILVLLGDRLEMLCAALSIIPYNVPIAHIHGGELSEGSYDDSVRHALTKLSHIHFVCHYRYQERLLQMGEEKWRVHNVGALRLDELKRSAILPDRDGYILVLYHPETAWHRDVRSHVDSLLHALRVVQKPVIFIAPNADPCSDVVRTGMENYVAYQDAPGRAQAELLDSVYPDEFGGLMKNALVMVGNSSSGIIEAASLHLPVVNVGDRQTGRIKPPNVIDCSPDAGSIIKAIGRANSDEFRHNVKGWKNPFGDGHAAERIVQQLKICPTDKVMLKKHFVDYQRF